MCTRLSLCAVLTARLLLAQSSGIAGFIYDASSRPVSGAQIQCGNKTATTQADGSFALPGFTDRCEAQISSPGFATQQTQLSGSNNRIILTIAGMTQEVVVSALRSPVASEQAAVAGTVFTAADLQARQAPFVSDLLREVPGVEIIRTGRLGSQTSIFTRGAPPNGTLILIDGIPQNPPGDAANLAHLLTGDIDRIEVVRGPQSALFGAQSSAGVVQLFTRKGDPENGPVPHGSVSYERGSFQTDRWLANLNGGAFGKFDYSLTTEQLHTVGQYGNDYYRDTNGTANVGWRFSPKTQVRGLFRTYDEALGSPGLVGYGLFNTDAADRDRVYSASGRVEDARSGSFLQRAYGQYWHERYSYTDLVTDGPYSAAALVRDEVVNGARRTYLVGLVPPGTIAPSGQRLVVAPSFATTLYPSAFGSETYRGGAGYSGSLAQGLAGSLVFGYDFERQGGVISTQDVSRTNNGFFANEQYTLGKRLTLVGGVRLEHSSVFGAKWTPRGAVSWLITEKARGPLGATFLRVSAGRGVREPSLLQNFANEAFYVGNRNLRLEKTNSYEAGLVQEWFGRSVRTEFSAFHNTFRDLINFYTPPGAAKSTFDNIDASYGRGMELAGSWRGRHGVTITGQHTWLWTRVVSSTSALTSASGIGQELARRPHHATSASFAVAPRRWSLQTTVRYFGERQDTGDFVFGVTRAPGYWNVDAAGSYRLTRNLLLFVRGENLGDVRYEESLGYAALGRAVRGGVRVSW